MERLKEQGTQLGRDISIHVNNNRHQFKESECGVYSINFIESLLKVCYIKNIENKSIISAVRK